MFTSEPSLAQRIERMIGDTPVVDPHCHLRLDQPNAPDLAALMGDLPVVTELIGVGMPPGDLDPALPPDERVRRSIPHLKRMRNTATAWCLFRIFRDLYDFDEPNLTDGNYRGLFDKVARTGQDPEWARGVLRDRSKIVAVVTGLANRGADPSKDLDSFFFRLDAHQLFWPGVATRAGYFETIVGVLGEAPTTPDRLDRLVADWLGRTIVGRVRFTSTTLPIEHRFRPPDDGETRALLDSAGAPGGLTDPEIDRLADTVAWSVLKWHHENRKPLQIAFGAGNPASDGESDWSSRGSWASEMARTFRRFGGARFDLMMASDTLGHDAALLARQFPNVYASADWGHDVPPMTLERNIGLRVQVAPMTKVGGFASDAPFVEWSYARLQVVRKAMAAALARLVEARFFEEDEIPPLLLQILHDTPRDLYGLDVG